MKPLIEKGENLKVLEPILHIWNGHMKTGYFLSYHKSPHHKKPQKFSGCFWTGTEWKIHENAVSCLFRLNPILDSLKLENVERQNILLLLRGSIENIRVGTALLSDVIFTQKSAAEVLARDFLTYNFQYPYTSINEKGVICFPQRVSRQYMKRMKRLYPKQKFKSCGLLKPERAAYQFVSWWNGKSKAFRDGDNIKALKMEQDGKALRLVGNIPYSVLHKTQKAWPEWSIGANCYTSERDEEEATKQIEKLILKYGKKSIIKILKIKR